MATSRSRPRSRVNRVPDRADYDLETVGGILDAATVCHVGVVDDRDFPVVIPVLHARDDRTLYLHGSSASRLFRTAPRSEVCVTATLVDGLVLARSVFHHSVNYRSVVLFGEPRRVEREEDKRAALRAFTEKLIPGRWNDAREPSSQELKATAVLAMEIDEASAKVRTGGAVDEDEDYELPVWAGTIPLRTVAGEPIPDDRLLEGVTEPGYVGEYRRARS
jgi:nitroimidazol reductase NimA-like FMN-containing flavoprotein (pyridoxamine 5'-phosphate oxidase superfamily)